MKNLGWLLGIAACPIFGLCAAYAGNLLSRAKNSYRPQCRSYVDLAEYVQVRSVRSSVNITYLHCIDPIQVHDGK